MWFGVLGRLEIRDVDGCAVRVAGSVRRRLLAALLCRAGDLVAASTLIEDLWGTVPPRTAAKTLQSHLVRLRDDLDRSGGEVIRTDGGGYRLDLSAAEFDFVGFGSALEAGLASHRRGDDAGAVEALDVALALWRGEAYADFADAAFTLDERMRLADLRAVALEARTDAQLRLGAAGTLVAELEQRIRREPYRERSWEQLILALYRSGRQAEALATYRAARDRLAADLGVDPGPSLHALEERVLRQDPALLADGGSGPRSATVAAAQVVGGRCPYRGLDGYGTDDAAVFVGRERLTAQLVGQLAEPGAVVVTGVSGSGKSSLVRAGMVPALRAGALPWSARWRVAVRVPGEALHSFSELDVLVIDQAEELFTLLDARERAASVERLRCFVDRDGRLVVVLRGDFFANLADLPWLAGYAQHSSLLVGPMREDELARVLVEPARRAGVEVSSDVVDAVLADAAGQAQPLPLISLSLVRAWEHRSSDTITLESYRTGGGVAGALEAAAESVYAGMSDDLRATSRRLLVRMAVLDGASWVRRPLARTSLSEAEAAATEALTAGRLVTTTASRVEVSHDALLERWPRLRDWLGERVAAADLLEHLAEATRAWVVAGRPDTDLHRGPRLQAVLDWRHEHPDDLSPDENAFLDASAAAADAELRAAEARAATQARGRRRLRWVVAALAAALALVVAGALVAVHLRSRADQSAAQARRAALAADAGRLAASSLSSSDLTTSALLAVAGYRLQDSAATRGAILSALERSQSALYRIAMPRRIYRMIGSADGSRLYALDDGGVVQVIDPAKRAIIAHYGVNAFGLVGVAAGGADLVLYGTAPRGPYSELSVIDAATGRTAAVLNTHGAPCCSFVPAMTPGGRWIASEETARPPFPGGTLTVYDADDWGRPARTKQFGSDLIQLAAARNLLAAETADRTLYLIDPASMRILAAAHRADLPSETQVNGGLPFALSPDGQRLAFSSDGSTTRLLDTAHPTAAARRLPEQGTRVTALNFSADGSRLAIGAAGGSLNVYATADASPVATLAGHFGDVNGVVWARSGGLFSAGFDKQVISWSLAPTSRLLIEHGTSVPMGFWVGQFGDHMIGEAPPLQGDVPGTAARIFDLDLATGTYRSWPAQWAFADIPVSVSVTRDGSRALVGVLDQDIPATRWQVWDLSRGKLLATVSAPAGTDETEDRAAAISPDGHTAVAALGDATLGVLSLPSGRLIRSFDVSFRAPHTQGLFVVPGGFAPDGRLLIFDSQLSPLESPKVTDQVGLVDLATGHLTAEAGIGDGAANAVGWSHDGRKLAVGTEAGIVDVFAADNLRLLAQAPNAQAQGLSAVSFSPDDRTIVSSGLDAAMNFWDAATMAREGPPITVPGSNSGWFAGYAPDGSVSGLAPDISHPAQEVDRVFTFPGRINQWVRQACALAGSDISRAQWATYVGSRQPYRHVCAP